MDVVISSWRYKENRRPNSRALGLALSHLCLRRSGCEKASHSGLSVTTAHLQQRVAVSNFLHLQLSQTSERPLKDKPCLCGAQRQTPWEQ